MLKKVFIVLCVLCLTGCVAKAPQADYVVELVCDLNEPVYGIHQEYSVEGESFGEGNCIRADNQAFSRGDTISLSYLPENFTEDVDGKDITIKVYVSGYGNTETYLGTLEKTVRFGTTETVKLSEIQ